MLSKTQVILRFGATAWVELGYKKTTILIVKTDNQLFAKTTDAKRLII